MYKTVGIGVFSLFYKEFKEYKILYILALSLMGNILWIRQFRFDFKGHITSQSFLLLIEKKRDFKSNL